MSTIFFRQQPDLPDVLTMGNGLMECEICPPAARLLAFRDGRGDYLYSLPAQLPDGPRAAGIGDIIHNPSWEGGKYEYLPADRKLAGYDFCKEQDETSLRITVSKDRIHDVAEHAWMPGLSIQRTFSLKVGSPVLEILDIRKNLDSCRHPMLYDLMFCLMPGTGGHHRNGMIASPWQQIYLELAGGSPLVFGREVVVGREQVFANVTAVSVWDPVRNSGVRLALDSAMSIGLLTSIGGPWQPFLSVRPRSPVVLSRYQEIHRTFSLSSLESVPKLRIRTPRKLLCVDERRTWKERLAAISDSTSRACLGALLSLGDRMERTGGEAHKHAAAEFFQEFAHLLPVAEGGKSLVENFLNEARLAEIRQLAATLHAPEPPPIADNPLKPESNLVESTVLAIACDDARVVKKNLREFRRRVLGHADFEQCVISPQTITNAGWGESLILLFCCFEPLLTPREKAHIFSVLWFLTREIDTYGCGVHGNWGTMERTFLLRAAGFFPFASRRETWIEKAVECLEETILSKASPDGGWSEPPGYTHHALLKGLDMLELLEAAGERGHVEKFGPGLKKMMAFQWRILQPSGVMPPIGNGWHVLRADIYNRYARRFGIGPLMQLCFDDGWRPTGKDLLSPGTVPKLLPEDRMIGQRGSDLLPHDGYALFRPDAETQLQIFFGWQMGHGHADTLSFLLFAHGRPFVEENVSKCNLGPGPNYGSRVAQNWTRQSRSHSMLLADDLSYTEKTPGRCVLWEGSGQKIHGIFEAPAYPGVLAQREVVMDGRSFVLKDRLSALPEGAGEFTWRAHFPEDITLRLDGTVVTASAPEGEVRFLFSDLPPEAVLSVLTSPPADFKEIEPVSKHGRMLLLRLPAAEACEVVCRIEIVSHPPEGPRGPKNS